MRVKAVITDVSAEGKGPSIVVSRRSPELIKELFELEVPEIADDLVEIVGVAREPGFRSKIAVISHADGVDPVGACVGPRGSRVRMVVSELRGEKIDIIPHNDEPARFVAKALSPARVREVIVDDETKEATVIVPDDQLSLAIGREGQNARLAAKLTGWKVDIKSETDFSHEDAGDIEGEGEVDDGRCAADHLDRPPLPERIARRLALLRPAAAPVARPVRHQQGDRARTRSPTTRSQILADPDADDAAGRRDRRQGRSRVRDDAEPDEEAADRRPTREAAPTRRGGRAAPRTRRRGARADARSRPRSRRGAGRAPKAPSSEEAAEESRRPKLTRRRRAEEPTRSLTPTAAEATEPRPTDAEAPDRRSRAPRTRRPERSRHRSRAEDPPS